MSDHTRSFPVDSCAAVSAHNALPRLPEFDACSTESKATNKGSESKSKSSMAIQSHQNSMFTAVHSQPPRTMGLELPVSSCQTGGRNFNLNIKFLGFEILTSTNICI